MNKLMYTFVATTKKKKKTRNRPVFRHGMPPQGIPRKKAFLVGLMVCSRASSVSFELFLQGWQLVKVRLLLSFKKGFLGAKWIVRTSLLLALNCFYKVGKTKMFWYLAKT